MLEPKAKLHSGRGKNPRRTRDGGGRGGNGLKPRSLTFGGGARACGDRSANFSLSAAFRTCSSGTCRLTRSRKSRLERGTFSPETAGRAEVSGASHLHSRALPAVCTPHPPPRSPPGHSGSGTTFSAVPPRPLWHRTGPRLRPARPATRDSGPGCSAAPEPLGLAAPRASRSVWRRPAPSPTRLGKAAPGGSGPGSREQGSEEVGVGSSAGCRPGLTPPHLPPLAGPTAPVCPPLPPPWAAVRLLRAFGQWAQAQVQAGLRHRDCGLWGTRFWGRRWCRHGLFPFH